MPGNQVSVPVLSGQCLLPWMILSFMKVMKALTSQPGWPLNKSAHELGAHISTTGFLGTDTLSSSQHL